jgi:hypothetical protein
MIFIGGDAMKIGDQSDILEYQIALSDDGSYMRLTFLVDITNELVDRAHVEMSRLSEETGVLKHLVDSTRVRAAQSVTDMCMLIHNELSVSPLFKTFKIAIVTHPDDSSHNFIETLLVNSGATGKIFKNEDQALAWLKE